MKKNSLQLLAIALIIISCDYLKQVNYSFEHKLIYVEGASLSYGKFGNIVLLDPVEKEKKWITKDLYYDESPFFNSTGNKIYFSSKRSGNDLLSGLTEQSSIYSTDLDVINVEKVAEPDSSIFINLIGLNRDSNSLFLLRRSGDSYLISVQDSLGKVIDEFYPQDNRDNSFSYMFFSSSGKYFVAQSLVNSGAYHFTTYLYDFENRSYISFLDDKVDSDLGLLYKDANCFPGSFLDSQTFLISCSVYRDKVSKLFRYSIEDDSLVELYRNNNIRFYNPILGSESSLIYFIAENFSDREDQNVWMYNFQKDSLERITNSKTEKDWLQVY